MKNFKASPILIPFSAVVLAVGVYFINLIQMAGEVRFIADDYCAYNYAARLGMARYAWFWFITWGGRLSAVSADMLLVLLGQKFIGYTTLTALLLWVAAFIGICIDLIDEKLTRSTRWLVSMAAALVMVFVITLSVPNFIQTLFWFSAFRTHTLPIILFTIWLFFAQRVARSTKYKVASLAGLFLYAFANAAFSEVFTSLQISVLGLVFLVGLTNEHPSGKRSGNTIIAVGLAGGLAGFALMLFAPGTSNRESFFTGDRSIIGIMDLTMQGTTLFFEVIFREAARSLAIASGLFFAFAIGPTIKELKLFKKLAGWKLVILPLLAPVLVFIAFLPGAYGMGEWIPRRSWSIPLFFSYTTITFFFIMLGRRLLRDRKNALFLPAAIVGSALLALALLASLPSLRSDLTRMREYATTIDQVEAEIASAKVNGAPTFTVGELGNWAGVYDPSDNPKFWVTKCFSEYHSIDVIGPPNK